MSSDTEAVLAALGELNNELSNLKEQQLVFEDTSDEAAEITARITGIEKKIASKAEELEDGLKQVIESNAATVANGNSAANKSSPRSPGSPSNRVRSAEEEEAHAALALQMAGAAKLARSQSGSKEQATKVGLVAAMNVAQEARFRKETLARCAEFSEEDRAASVIEGTVQGYVDRGFIADVDKSAQRIQGGVQGKDSRERLTAMESSSIVLQGAVTGTVARRECDKAYYMGHTEAAAVLQGHAIGQDDRRHLKVMENNVSRVQGGIRGKVARDFMSAEVVRQDLGDVKALLSHLGESVYESTLKAMLKEAQDRQLAASRIQGLMRGAVAKESFDVEFMGGHGESVARIQAMIRRKEGWYQAQVIEHKYHERLHKAHLHGCPGTVAHTSHKIHHEKIQTGTHKLPSPRSPKRGTRGSGEKTVESKAPPPRTRQEVRLMAMNNTKFVASKTKRKWQRIKKALPVPRERRIKKTLPPTVYFPYVEVTIKLKYEESEIPSVAVITSGIIDDFYQCMSLERDVIDVISVRSESEKPRKSGSTTSPRSTTVPPHWSVFIVVHLVSLHVESDPRNPELPFIEWIENTAQRLRQELSLEESHPFNSGTIMRFRDNSFPLEILEVPIPKEVSAAKQMQALVEGNAARRETSELLVLTREDSAISLQALFRGKDDREKIEKFNASARTLQAGIAGLSTRSWIGSTLEQLTDPEIMARSLTSVSLLGLPRDEKKRDEIFANAFKTKISMQDAGEKLDMLKALFYGNDSDGSGDLDADELAVVIRGWYRSEKVSRTVEKTKIEIDQAMIVHDSDKSGSLNFLEFLALWGEAEKWFHFHVEEDLRKKVLWLAREAVYTEAQEEHEKLRALFLEADIENDGVLDVEQLTTVFRKCYKNGAVSRGLAAVKLEVEEAMITHDLDGSGTLDYVEFVLMWASGRPLKLRVDSSVRQQVVRIAMLPVTREAANLLNDLVALFDAADMDSSGLLDRDELTAVFTARYREENVARTTKKVREELDIAMLRQNTDSSGLIDFVEFVNMSSGPPFKFCTSSRVRSEVKLLMRALEMANTEEQETLQVQLHELQNDYIQGQPQLEERLHTLEAALESSTLRRVKPKTSEVELRVRKVLTRAFSNLDENGDGLLDEDELITMMRKSANVRSEEDAKEQAKGMIQGLDKDGDGAISFEEWTLLEDRIVEELMDWVRDIDSPSVVERELKRYERKFRTSFGLELAVDAVPGRFKKTPKALSKTGKMAAIRAAAQGGTPAEVAKAAYDAVIQAGGEPDMAADIGGKAAGDTLISRNYSGEEAAKAAAKAARDLGGSSTAQATSAGATMERAGGTAADAATVVIQDAREMGASISEAQSLAKIAAKTTVTAQGGTAVEIVRAANEPTVIDKATENLQSGIRGLAARNEVANDLKTLENEAAACILGGISGAEARNIVCPLKEALEKDSAERIQAVVRGHESRVQIENEQDTSLSQATAILQGGITGHAVRTDPSYNGQAVEVKSVERLQGVAHGLLERFVVKEKQLVQDGDDQDAAKRIQYTILGHKVRKAKRDETSLEALIPSKIAEDKRLDKAHTLAQKDLAAKSNFFGPKIVRRTTIKSHQAQINKTAPRSPKSRETECSATQQGAAVVAAATQEDTVVHEETEASKPTDLRNAEKVALTKGQIDAMKKLTEQRKALAKLIAKNKNKEVMFTTSK